MNKPGKIVTCIVLLAAATLNVSAQPKDGGKGWRERVMSEKIAFLTTAIGLTPGEAQAFWPVYNQMWEERGKAQFNVMKAYKALEAAVDGNKTKEIPRLLDSYLDALSEKDRIEDSCDERYRKVLPTEKVAKLYVADEKFRRQQIHKLHHKAD